MISFIGNAELASLPNFDKIFRDEGGGDISFSQLDEVNLVAEESNVISFEIPNLDAIDYVGELTEEVRLTLSVVNDMNLVHTIDGTMSISFTCDAVEKENYELDYE